MPAIAKQKGKRVTKSLSRDSTSEREGSMGSMASSYDDIASLFDRFTVIGDTEIRPLDKTSFVLIEPRPRTKETDDFYRWIALAFTVQGSLELFDLNQLVLHPSSIQSFLITEGNHPVDDRTHPKNVLRDDKIRYLDPTRAFKILESATLRVETFQKAQWRLPTKYGFAATKAQWFEYIHVAKRDLKGATAISKMLDGLDTSKSPDQTIVAGHFFELGEPGSSEHPDRLRGLSPLHKAIVLESLDAMVCSVPIAADTPAGEVSQEEPTWKKPKDNFITPAPPSHKGSLGLDGAVKRKVSLRDLVARLSEEARDEARKEARKEAELAAERSKIQTEQKLVQEEADIAQVEADMAQVEDDSEFGEVSESVR